MSTVTATSSTRVQSDAVARSHGRASVAWTWTYRLMLVSVVALAVYATLVPWMIQRSGAKLVTITSGSMMPLLPVGSTVTIHEATDPTSLQPGQIITFKAMGNGTVISHRIVERLDTPTLGGVFYQTKGDANRTADPDLAPAGNIIGVVDSVLPTWQGAAVAMQTPKGRLAVYGSLFLVIALGEVVDLAVSGSRRRRVSTGVPA